MPPRFLLAKRKAAELIAAVNIEEAPVSLEKIAKYLNVALQFEPFSGDLSGMLHIEGGSAVIGINANHPDVRKRFTLAHELGHLVLHSEETLHVDSAFPVVFRDESSGLGTDRIEIEANQFAAALLMPEAFLRNDIAEYGYESDFEDTATQLAKKYRVSIQAMSIRLSRLGLLGN